MHKQLSEVEDESSGDEGQLEIHALLQKSRKEANLEAFAFDTSESEERERKTVAFEPPELIVEQKIDSEKQVGPSGSKKRRCSVVLTCNGEKGVKRARTSDWKTKDLSLHQRKSAWVDAYGDARVAKCFVCRFNEVGWENIGFDMAHVVARGCGGNNDESWNRVPTCNTCNKNVSNETNLLDFVAEFYPQRLIPVVRYLWHRFKHRNSFMASHFIDHGLEAFVRTLYGCCGVQTDPNSSLAKYLQRKVGASERKGLIQNEQVYVILRKYDQRIAQLKDSKQAIKQLDKEIDSMQLVLNRLRRLKESEQAKRRRLLMEQKDTTE